MNRIPGSRILEGVFAGGHLLLLLLFLGCATVLAGMAAVELWQALRGAGATPARFDAVLGAIGLLTVALVALELAQTIFEEEVQRDVKVSGPTRVRRYLSRFFVVIIIALAIETLVAVFEQAHDAPANLPYAVAIGACSAMLLVALGVFVRLNRSAEELEPEALEETKREDRKLG